MNRLLLIAIAAALLITAPASAETPVYVSGDRVNAEITYGDVLAWHARHAATAPVWRQGTDVFIPNPADPRGSRRVARYASIDADVPRTPATRLRLAGFVMPDASGQYGGTEVPVVYRTRTPWWGSVLGWLVILGGLAIVGILLAIHVIDRKAPRRPQVASSSDVLAELADASDDALRSAQDEFAAAMAFLHTAFRETAR